MADGETFHLLACSLDLWGGEETSKIPDFLEECLNALQIPEGETIALMVSDYHPTKGHEERSYIYEILGAIARSKASAVVYCP